MKQFSYCLFETALGSCGICWKESENPGGENPVVAFQLPEASIERTEQRISRKCSTRRSSDPPQNIAALIRRVGEHLSGAMQDFRDVQVELDSVGEFAARVYQATREIPAGKTSTYGELARALGRGGSARAVGQALGRNPIPLIIPCHRVLAAGGKSGGFSAHGGPTTKAKMLALEGAKFTGNEASRLRESQMLFLWNTTEDREAGNG
jgi:O-6-methylguanine DNA methyltransferase